MQNSALNNNIHEDYEDEYNGEGGEEEEIENR